ncbi:winged helix-turn-helix domain-containing protein [Streptomyces sp. NBC_01511]|uniref:winged helix-turn-helix domain-containing protein n=1 Tax=unclassified Streptomyces TaxID=2593676 RepID=UPI00386B66C5
MANPRPFSTVTAATAAAAASTTATTSGRHRLRAVDRDEVVPLGTARAAGPVIAADRLVDFLPPGSTWLPAPAHTLPTLPGRPPMIGYLVLVPADQHPVAATAAATAPAPGGDAGEGPVRIDSAERTVEVAGRPLDLTYLEFELLAHLVAHPHRVHTRDQLVTTVWGYGHVGDGRTVDVHVARLRRKLGIEHRHTIRTIRRVGYKYAP